VWLLDVRALGAIGLVSYSFYLWQFPIVDALAGRTELPFGGLLPLALVACLAVAIASYVAVERPFLRMRSRWGPTLARHGKEDSESGPAAALGDARP
jgi:peptidoglycan/LPS O-acetylase OafA/YrhL